MALNFSDRKIIITGGAGTGKTTLLNALQSRGHLGVPETARSLIQRRKQQGLSPRPAPVEFAQEILQIDIDQYHLQVPNDDQYLFFDRSIFDALCMLNELQALTSLQIDQYVLNFPYCRKVFVLEPWQEIYVTDEERDQIFFETIQTHEKLCAWYTQCGFELVTVPKISVQQRGEFLLGKLQ